MNQKKQTDYSDHSTKSVGIPVCTTTFRTNLLQYVNQILGGRYPNDRRPIPSDFLHGLFFSMGGIYCSEAFKIFWEFKQENPNENFLVCVPALANCCSIPYCKFCRDFSRKSGIPTNIFRKLDSTASADVFDSNGKIVCIIVPENNPLCLNNKLCPLRLEYEGIILRVIELPITPINTLNLPVKITKNTLNYVPPSFESNHQTHNHIYNHNQFHGQNQNTILRDDLTVKISYPIRKKVKEATQRERKFSTVDDAFKYFISEKNNISMITPKLIADSVYITGHPAYYAQLLEEAEKKIKNVPRVSITVKDPYRRVLLSEDNADD